METIIQTQHHQIHPWQPVTAYTVAARRQVEGPHPALIRQHLLTNPQDTVLDVGCGPHAALVQLLRETGVTAHGCDTSVIMPSSIPHLFCGNVTSRSGLGSPRTWSVVICREVIEHLPLRFINRAVVNLCDVADRFVYVTTRFTKGRHLLDIDTRDGLDPTHITMMHPDVLRLLFVLQGFIRRPILEHALDWQHQGRCLVYERTL